MQPVHSLRLALGLTAAALALSLTPPAAGQAPKKGPPSKDIKIPTFDGVSLDGKLYANSGGKRDAVVVLLHHFDTKKGGSSQADGWSDLVAGLHADGYSVLTFDFRGFGDSKTVDKEKFWSYKHNQFHAGGKKGDTIAFGTFKNSYYPYLVNDVAAVKAYLDRRNDSGDLNSANVILIGDRDGAAVGSMWLAHESRRRRDKSEGKGLVALGDAEVKDVAAAVWLSPSSSIGPKAVGGSMAKWTADAGKTHKVPMAFVYAKNDSTSDTIATNLLRTLKPMGAKGKDLPLTVIERIPDTKLKGAALLDKELDTIRGIRGYLSKVMEERGARERNERSPTKSVYWYTQSAASSKPARINKPAGEDVGPVEVPTFLPTAAP